MIQALLLTQVEFSLAATYHSQESYQEAALKFQKMTDKSTSLIIGAGCVQYALNGMAVPSFKLNSLFMVLGGSCATLVESVSSDGRCVVTNDFYKVFIEPAITVNPGSVLQGILLVPQAKRMSIAMGMTAGSRAPPAVNKNRVEELQPNC